jgi:hypothetical protein
MRRAGAMLVLLALTACAERDLWPAERLDPKSAVNVTLMAEPWVFARPVPMLAANARDYLNIGVMETNRMGERAYWLGVVSWSTIDRSPFAEAGAIARPERIRLGWKDAVLVLSPAPGGRAAAGLSAPAFTRPAERFADAWYPLTAADVLRLGAAAPETVALVTADGTGTTYDAWQVDSSAMTEFLKATGLDRP